ncbi:MAG: hypothetical protein ACI9JN_000114 [Bacteroidia bacterium]|jgi:hypothetical protein
MKTLLVTTIIFTLMFFQIGATVGVDSKLTATFMGSNDDGAYLYKDAANTTHEFAELSDDVDYGYLDDSYVGKKFIITWNEVDADVYDDEGDENGETVKVKQILTLTLAK